MFENCLSCKKPACVQIRSERQKNTNKRTTRLELATSTLGRLHSTTELRPLKSLYKYNTTKFFIE